MTVDKILKIGMIAIAIANLETVVRTLSCAAGIPALRYSATNMTTKKEEKKAIKKPSFPLSPVKK